MKLKVAYDIDGVFADFGKYLLKYLEIEDKTTFKIYKDPRITENFSKIENDYRFWMNIPVLNRWKESYPTPEFYLTARTIPKRITENWLAINGFPKAEVVNCLANNKGNYLNGKVDVFVEDSMMNCIHIDYQTRETVTPIILDTTYNKPKTEDEKKIYRINSLDELKILKAFSK